MNKTNKEYKKLICRICGWIYDEELGSPTEGIDPGTRWEDVPEDWTCPVCNVPKRQFDMIDL
jgi:rubredoxin